MLMVQNSKFSEGYTWKLFQHFSLFPQTHISLCTLTTKQIHVYSSREAYCLKEKKSLSFLLFVIENGFIVWIHYCDSVGKLLPSPNHCQIINLHKT